MYDRMTLQIASQALANGGGSIDIGANEGEILRHLIRMSLGPTGPSSQFQLTPRGCASAFQTSRLSTLHLPISLVRQNFGTCLTRPRSPVCLLDRILKSIIVYSG